MLDDSTALSTTTAVTTMNAASPFEDHEPATPHLDLTLLINGIALITLLFGFGVALVKVQQHEAGVARQEFTISGAVPVPVLRFTPALRQGDAIAVVVHGYAGDKELMTGFGIALARIGVPSYLLDLPGHGESPVGLGDNAQLQAALDETVAYARAHADVANPRIVLIGHSRGTQVVGQYALAQPLDALAATILISPVLQQLPTLNDPANLLVVVGQGDLASVVQQAPKLIGAACGGGLPAGGECGDPAQGTGRRLVVAPGVNHITILTDPTTLRAVNAWVAATSGIPDTATVGDERVHWALIGAGCAVLALFPLLALLTAIVGLRESRPAPAPAPPTLMTAGAAPAVFVLATATADPLAVVPALATDPLAVVPALAVGQPTAAPGLGWRRLLGMTALATLGAVLAVRLWSAVADLANAPALRSPLTWSGVQLGDTAGSLLLALAGALLVAALVARRRPSWPASRRALRQAAVGVAAAAFLYVTLSAVSSLTWERLWLDAPRLWRVLPLAVAALPFFALAEGAVTPPFAAAGTWSVALRLWLALLASLGLAGLIVLDARLFFLSLLAPLQLLLFVVFAAVATRLRALGRDTGLAGAVFAALIFAWVVAAVFPIAA